MSRTWQDLGAGLGKSLKEGQGQDLEVGQNLENLRKEQVSGVDLRAHGTQNQNHISQEYICWEPSFMS